MYTDPSGTLFSWSDGKEHMGTLVSISKARKALAAATSLDDILTIRNQAVAIKTYMKASGESLLVQNQAAEIKMRAERKAGTITAAIPKSNPGRRKKGLGDSVSPKPKKEILEDAGLSKKQANRLETIAGIPDDVFEDFVDVDTTTEAGEEITQAKALQVAKHGTCLVSKYTGNNEWFTPERYVKLARSAMGGIDMDPASNKFAQEWIKAKRFFTEADNGLEREWAGRVWLNPPYERGLITKFSTKVVEEVQKKVTQAIVLTNNATDANWFQILLAASSCVCFTNHRLCFESSEGTQSSPLNGQVFFYFGDRAAEFYEEFTDVGLCVEVVEYQ